MSYGKMERVMCDLELIMEGVEAGTWEYRMLILAHFFKLLKILIKKDFN